MFKINDILGMMQSGLVTVSDRSLEGIVHDIEVSTMTLPEVCENNFLFRSKQSIGCFSSELVVGERFDDVVEIDSEGILVGTVKCELVMDSLLCDDVVMERNGSFILIGRLIKLHFNGNVSEHNVHVRMGL